MSVNSVTLSSATQASTPTSSTTTKGFTADDFMTLLLTQLKNQNPMEPMDQNDMISQMTQINSVQELQKLSTIMKSMEQTNQLLSATNMIGKNVTYKGSDEEFVEGVVRAVSVEDGSVFLTIGNDTIELTDVLAIR